MATEFSENSVEEKIIFYCKYCDYKCSRSQYWKQHILTKKHKNRVGNNVANSGNNMINGHKYACVCNRSYRDRSGLWKHRRTCSVAIDTNDTSLTPEMVIQLIEQNKELQQTIVEQNKAIIELVQKTGTHTTINNNCGNNNNTFNLQLFLNETCRDAINMSDFLNQIKVSLSELEDTGKLGYAEGISKVFIKNLNDINDRQRPLHCSDTKREIIYIKENNQWTKDDETKSNLINAIKQVANKNIRQIGEWQKVHPNYLDPTSKENDKYMKIVFNSMSGSTKEESDKNYEKIAKNIAKKVVIDKSSLPSININV
jgi:hypothetical protein